MSGERFFVNRYDKMGWRYQGTQPRQAVRLNSMNIGKEEILKRLECLGVKLKKIPFLKDGYWVSESKFSVGAISEYLLGLYSIQEAAAQIPVTLFTDLKNKTVLDACAAPGGKTVQLADLMRNTGVIIALDFDKGRLTAMANQLERCHVENTIAYCMDAKQASTLKLQFDRILLDVPCSGNFVIDQNWFQKRTIEDVERNARLQREILAASVNILMDDGEIIYSTCSLEPEEDEFNIDWAIKNLGLAVDKIDSYGDNGLTTVFHKQLDPSIEDCRRIWPDKTQGFFICKLKK